MVMTMTQYHTDKAAWDSRQLYFQTLGEALRLSFEARVSKNAYAWFSILDGLVSQYGPGFKSKEELKGIRSDIDGVNNVLHPSEEDGLMSTQRSSVAIDLLRKLEPRIVAQLYSSGLLTPRVANPRYTANQGLDE